MSTAVIVESPTKAKTIGKYLGKGYNVLASYGHVRDLLAKDGAVEPANGFKMHWVVSTKSKKYIDAIKASIKGDSKIVLATDPDREGEAIAWHVIKVLKDSGALKNQTIERIVFHEITKEAVKDALNKPRNLNQQLIEAYLARRALDYLYGFTLSPLLWRKLPGARSAGRVQSVALRLISDREKEIEQFISQEYWDIEGIFSGNNLKDQKFSSKLIILDNEKLEKFSLDNKEAIDKAILSLKSQNFKVDKIVEKKINRSSYPPFITSTLQQEAYRHFGFSAARTMRIAQSLYEGIRLNGETLGLITYMRTDSTQISKSAVSSIRDFIKDHYLPEYLPKNPKEFKKKVKNAQEAHEAIRPTQIILSPDQLKNVLDMDQFKLYELIWKRAVASQMEDSVFKQVSIDIISSDLRNVFRATGSICTFDGYLVLYRDSDDKQEDEKLPYLKEKQPLLMHDIKGNQHFSQPPPRYNEASLIRKLEELGIGRPSTYAFLIETLKERKYIKVDQKKLVPEARGRVVIAFLLKYFPKYVEYSFTAGLEEQLDEISSGKLSWEESLQSFWEDFYKTVDSVKEVRISSVISEIEGDLKHLLKIESCPTCEKGTIHLKLSRYGAFWGCSNYPDCKYMKPLDKDESNITKEKKEIVLGVDPETKENILLKNGPYGPYLEWIPLNNKKIKPKRIALKNISEADNMNLDKALFLKSLPKVIGNCADNPVEFRIGRFGPYLHCNGKSKPIPKSTSIFDIDLGSAKNILGL